MSNANQLTWHDLSADAVYDVAHQENDTRNHVIERFSTFDQWDDSAQEVVLITQSLKLLYKQTKLSNKWFQHQAKTQDAEAYTPAESSGPTALTTWLECELAEPVIAAKSNLEICSAADIGDATLLNWRTGEVTIPRPKTIAPLLHYVSTEKGINETERRQFLQDSVLSIYGWLTKDCSISECQSKARLWDIHR